MTLLSGESTGEIHAPLEHCWSVVAAIERSSEWQRGIQSVVVLDRDGAGRATECEVVLDIKVHQVRARLGVSYEAPYRMTFERIESEDIDELRGSWELLELAAARTRATYRLAVDPGPVGLLARPLERALRPIIVGARPEELARVVASGSR